MLGTYAGYRTVGVGADGLPEAKEDAYTIGWLTGPLVVKEGTTLTAEIFNSNGNPETIVLTTRTELTPKRQMEQRMWMQNFPMERCAESI